MAPTISFDKIDFSKPDRFTREIADFLSSVTLVADSTLRQKGRAISSNEARLLIDSLLQLMVPNLAVMPSFTPKEVQHLFAFLQYPYQIRADAITAVGAPSSINFLMRAIYWLYLVARTYYRESQPGAILELSEEELKEEDEEHQNSNSQT